MEFLNFESIKKLLSVCIQISVHPNIIMNTSVNYIFISASLNFLHLFKYPNKDHNKDPTFIQNFKIIFTICLYFTV